ncbi:MAG TPA: peptide chain release factor N(5)-glutamine methyltransferase [Candidatus Limnocylindria bacterium]|nr:peptide chain release factor N(5)-glutamine methyltransferase [Candidatus Limnocylindria bacterium]
MATVAGLRRDALARIAALDADVLLAFALGVDKALLFAHPEREVTPEGAARFRGYVERRAAGEPVAYIRGWKEFYGLELAVDPRVLIPRPETETLVDAVRASGARLVADVGTGSGAVAVALAVHEPGSRVIATDVSADALDVARENARRHGVADRVELRQGDLLAPIVERVDVVAANLPYLTDDSVERWVGERASLAFEPRVAVLAGPDGLALIRRAIADLPRVLVPGGEAFFECDPPQARALAAEHGGRTIRDLAGNERVVAIRPMMAP